MRAGFKRVEHWLVGLCGGLLVALSALFAASGWGIEVASRGMSSGALVFYGSWAISLGGSLLLQPRMAAVWMGYAVGAGWLAAALGSMVRASEAMRWHPVVAGVNLAFCALGLLFFGVSFGYQRLGGGHR